MTSASEPDKSDFAETVTLSGSDYSLLPVVITAGSVSNTGSASVAAATTSASSTGSSDSTPGSTPSAATVTGTSTGTTAESSGGAGHMRPALGIGAAGALAAVAAVVL